MKTPFNMQISRYLLLLLEEKYIGHFDYIVLLCPTFSWNKSYQEWKYVNDPDLISLECPQAHVNTIHRQIDR